MMDFSKEYDFCATDSERETEYFYLGMRKGPYVEFKRILVE
jgi:hypothetical protein